MAEIRWSLTAEADLQGIEDFIAKDSVLHAVNFIDRLIKAAEQLTHAPKMGRIVPEFNREDLREVLFRAYRIVYQPSFLGPGLGLCLWGAGIEYLAGGMSEAQILADFPDLTAEDIRACLAFAATRERRLASSSAG